MQKNSFDTLLCNLKSNFVGLKYYFLLLLIQRTSQVTLNGLTILIEDLNIVRWLILGYKFFESVTWTNKNNIQNLFHLKNVLISFFLKNSQKSINSSFSYNLKHYHFDVYMHIKSSFNSIFIMIFFCVETNLDYSFAISFIHKSVYLCT